MKKSLFLASLAVLTFNVLGMNIPNDQGENPGNNTFQQINEENAGPNAQNTSIDNNLSAWFQAVKSNNLDEMKRLKRLSQGLDIFSKDEDGNTVLHIASANGNLDIVKWIFWVSDRYSVEPSDIVWFLLANKNHVILKNEDIQAWHDEAFHASLELVNTANGKKKTPLYMAVENGRLDVVQYLVEQGANVNERLGDDSTPLHVAAQNGDMDIVKYLVEHRASINARDLFSHTPLMDVLKQMNISKKHTPQELKKRENTAIYLALLDGVDFGIETIGGDTVLDLARQSREYINQIVEIANLVKQGVDINKENEKKIGTLLHTAAKNGNMDVVKYLVEHGANVNRTADYDESTPLHMAVVNRDVEMVKYLVEHGADINKQDSTTRSFTPLMYALDWLAELHPELFDRTISKENKAEEIGKGKDIAIYLAPLDGVDFDIKTKRGHTVLDLAKRTSREDIIQAVKEAKARRSTTE